MKDLLKTNPYRKRRDFSKIPQIMEIPDLIEVQKNSYKQFLQSDVPLENKENIGLQSVFNSVFPVRDFSDTSSLEFVSYLLGEPKFTEDECRQRGMTYAAPLKVTMRLVTWDKDKESGVKQLQDIKEQEVYLGEIPLMTERGIFIVNGTERTVVSQMHRSPGVFFSHDKGKTVGGGKVLYSARIIPYRGSWIELEFDSNDVLYVRIDRRRKVVATALLRAFGYTTTEEILKIFYNIETIYLEDSELRKKLEINELLEKKINFDIIDKHGNLIAKAGSKIIKTVYEKIKKEKIDTILIKKEDVINMVVASDVVNEETGEILIESGQKITDDIVEKVIENNIKSLELVDVAGSEIGPLLYDTLDKDITKTPEEAMMEIYKKLRPGDPPSVESATLLFNSLFLEEKRYDLSRVGRLKLNQKLGLDAPLTKCLLNKVDLLEIVRYLLKLKNGIGEIDDIDHLGNRRMRSVGELLENQFRVGLVRMERTIRERMSIRESDNIMPHELINAKPVTAVVNEFFGSSQLSQFLDQTNPLAELTHKRRLSALGPGGLSRERAGFEVRDVHPTHYGRICPIETPEGPNIGLIASLSTYATVDEYGFIKTPYRKVGKGKVSNKIEYLSASDEEDYVIAQANAPIDEQGKFVNERVSARKGAEFVMALPEQVDYMDVSPRQLVSVSTALIPFLEHDDANRALMGSNMQRQAVPLLRTDSPIVGTGMEGIVARDSGFVVIAKREGIVRSVSADRIIISSQDDQKGETYVDIYNLTKFQRSNQNTCINQKPLVKYNDRIVKSQIVADGPATSKGDLALGHNMLVAFMPWRGYNYEDAILISEKVVEDDRFTSVHIEEFEIEARDTKLGKEEITRDIPNVSDETLGNLDESGIIRVGAEVKPGDILVGKITPKGETQLTPEEKLLRAIFGEKAGDVRDASLYVPPGIEGVVVDVKIFSRKGVDKDARSRSIEEEKVAKLEKDLNDEIRILQEEKEKKIKDEPGELAENGIIIKKGLEDRILEEDAGEYDSSDIIESEEDSLESVVDKTEVEAEDQIDLLQSVFNEKVTRLGKGGELAPGVIKLVKVYVAMKRRLSVGDKMAGRHGNKGVVAKLLPQEDMPYLPDGTPVEVVLNPLGVPSRMNVGQILETHLGWAAKALGLYVATPVFDGATEKEIKKLLAEANLPESGQTVLYDGRTGEAFEQKVTVGYIYILKLAHLVDDKIHARSIGPYSLVTQQPLGGKAQFGGQRFGEMEVWALEAYGSAHTLQEILTIKSDDVSGRTKAYESIVKGIDLLEPGTPESFNVLVKELQSLCLDIELLQIKR
ncbi:MAG: DNA-directed RNA polymerase subunit beta [bacterium]